MQGKSSVNPEEIAKFEALASEWWDQEGKFKPLHMLNPCRLDFITKHISLYFSKNLTKDKPLRGLRVLDIGCGGGLLCEPMARLGAEVVGIDVVEKNIKVASIHARQSGLKIDYRYQSVEKLVHEEETFDVILNMEVIEHVDFPENFVESCSKLLNENGIMFCSTINRNVKSYLFAILGAEYIMNWLPKGTHNWKKFIKPLELKNIFEANKLIVLDTRGFVFNPVSWAWFLSSDDFSVNYAICVKKSAQD
jgi:2-polyprenyl-6-hydroxyphenyl methylase/3-demethylubiquinone-9 3-methyltransferase